MMKEAVTVGQDFFSPVLRELELAYNTERMRVAS
jgi:hypothetical protein